MSSTLAHVAYTGILNKDTSLFLNILRDLTHYYPLENVEHIRFLHHR